MSLKQCFKGSLDVPLIPYGRRVHKTIAATAGNVTTYFSPGAGKRWLIHCGRVTLVTDGTVANRQILLEVNDGTNIVQRFPTNSDAIAASLTRSISFQNVAGGVGVGAIDRAHISLGSVVLEGLDQFKVIVLNGQAGDSYSGHFVLMEYDV